jgi:hypothetical protein
LIAGATGTGKTVTLQTMAEKLSGIGVPVFMADVKGDLAGLAAAGSATPKTQERLALLKLAWRPSSCHSGYCRQSAARSIGSQVGREIFRGVLGSILGGSKRR